MVKKQTISKMIALHLKSIGVQSIFGVPGGGSSLDLIDAAESVGIKFYLVKREDAAVIMACVYGELTKSVGVALVTKGPGLSNAMNGIAYSALDRAPLILFSDGFSDNLRSFVTHQVFDQKTLMSPFSKDYTNLQNENPEIEFRKVVSSALLAPYGPVYIELISSVAQKIIDEGSVFFKREKDTNNLDYDNKVISLLKKSKKPTVVLGLENLIEDTSEVISKITNILNCPTLVTYKAKGVISDQDDNLVGIFTGGKAEQISIVESDLIILIGLDPVELILQPWPYDIPVLNISLIKHEVHYVNADANLLGHLNFNLNKYLQYFSKSIWKKSEIKYFKEQIKSKLNFLSENLLNPQSIVENAQIFSKNSPRISIDAGAHMFSATAFWNASKPFDVLISNGLATMGFALPAAISSALESPERGAIAFTGDGGFMMCCSELATAVQFNANILVIVFNDGALSLIDIKQKSRNLKKTGTTWPRSNFAEVASGFGCKSWKVENLQDYKSALVESFKFKGARLIDVWVDPNGYSNQLKSLRG
ncbi:thiamine pyrophosphate-binding protein [Alphaproteobacteria bacterium]|nr:thiamine pyrophosphate-binding protein [Alphaproteobacteria bacterium]